MKSIPPSYCLWCEEKLATKASFPYCSNYCRRAANSKERD